jgi:hypothetical protein
MTPSVLIPVREFCGKYGIGRTKLYELLSTGALEGVRVGSRTMITGDSAEQWAASLPRFKSAAASARATEAA